MSNTQMSAELYSSLIEAEKKKNRPKYGRVVPVVIILVLFFAPFYYLFVTIFKTSLEYAQNPVLALPQSIWPLWDNIIEAWVLADMGQTAFNSLTYAVIGGVVSVAFAAAAAYGLTRTRLRFANAWFMLIFAGTLFPFQMYLVPLFFGYQKLGIMNSRLGMMLIYTAVCIPFPLLVLRNSIAGNSHEIDEAARIEGASEIRIFLSMIIPNVKGALIALFLLQFTFIWNDLLFSSILANNQEVRSIMSALQRLQGIYSTKGPNILMTATLISSFPTVLLFVFLRKHFMSGMQISGH